MRIVQIHTCDLGGGAAKSAYRLHAGLKGLGHNSKFVVGKKYGADPDVIKLPGRGLAGARNAVAGKIEQFTGLQYFFRPSFNDLMALDAVKNADVVHFHNTHGGYLNLGVIKQAAEKKPVVWSLRDMWAFTGHCAYAGRGQCQKWESGCERCPFLGEYPAVSVDTASLLWKIKRNDAEACAGLVRCVSPSNWLCNLAKKSLLSPLLHSVIPNCVDTEIFFPRENRETIRQRLGVSRKAFMLSFMAAQLDNEFKGLPLLVEALSILKAEGFQITLLLIGNGKSGFDGPGLHCVSTGFVSDEAYIAELLSASDAFVAPSLADNQPLAILEALACGKPVIAFGVGGIPEMIGHKKDGFIARPMDAGHLADGIRWAMMLSESARTSVSVAALSKIQAKFSVGKTARAYLSLYNELI